MMSPTVKWHYDRVRDAVRTVVVTVTTMTYTLLYLGCLDNAAELPPTSAPAILLEFL